MSWNILITSADSKEKARTIAQHLLKNRLAGCVTVIPRVESTYWWKGKLERAREWLLLIKGRSSHFSKASREIKKIHSYECPEIISIPIQRGSADYLAWLDASLGSKKLKVKSQKYK
ncbi:MAG: divalent-cation tolerance protein CutA [Candidatus Omnitrophica bacterium]|nr:divalent-cation tolerance protein CutA [Candidatus Omnitrophota bacterium]